MKYLEVNPQTIIVQLSTGPQTLKWTDINFQLVKRKLENDPTLVEEDLKDLLRPKVLDGIYKLFYTVDKGPLVRKISPEGSNTVIHNNDNYRYVNDQGIAQYYIGSFESMDSILDNFPEYFI